MSVLTRIKYQYNLRILEDFVSSNNYYEFFHQLEKHKKNQELYNQLLSTIGITSIFKNNNDIFKSKIIWLSSYMQNDTEYISTFLNYYLNSLDDNFSKVTTYEEKIVSVLKKLLKFDSLKFTDLVERSYLYQYLILHENESPIKFIQNHIPFFSTPNNFNFTKNTLTNSFIYIIDHPYNVYKRIKYKNNGDQEVAKNIFLNLDNLSYFKDIDDVKVEVNKQGWHTHTLSWSNINVINSLNGKIILKKDLLNNTFETLSSILLHFVQSGSNIKMDYKIIKSFIDNNPYEINDFYVDLSNKEKKFIDQYVKDIKSSYNFGN